MPFCYSGEPLPWRMARVAKVANAVGNNKEAITYEIRGLDAIAKMEGKLSKEYIDELSYLFFILQ